MSLETGNVIFHPDPYKPGVQAIIAPDGNRYIWKWARAKLTDTLQTVIPLYVSVSKPVYFQDTYPDVPLTVPVGAQIQRVDFRLPNSQPLGSEVTAGIDVPRNCTIVGTTGENLKVSPLFGTTHTVTSPLITAANSLYTPNTGAVLQRGSGVVDAASPSLLQTVSGTALTLQMTVSNAGNTAVGTGIKLSATKATAFIYAHVVYRIDGDPIKPWNFELPFPGY
ncbi:MAG: hypothetical protein KME54_28850 [Tolypothrix brevis GSE-NOS-MK-07-07A]|nr:hypothetical protein [Tolypothrix brevis GSE-NOS-MK-07-07A]